MTEIKVTTMPAAPGVAPPPPYAVRVCDGTPIGGGVCTEAPCATVHVGPLLSCQTVVPMATDTHAQLHLCADHITPFVDMTVAHICCEDVSLTLVWDL